MGQLILRYLATQFALKVISVWVRTWEIQWETPKPPLGCVIALWHQDLPACFATFSHQQIGVLISASTDGDLFTRLAQSMGYQVFRGSSSRGQHSVRQLLRALHKGQTVGMALDGPRGPALMAKDGAAWLAKRAQVPLAIIEVRYTYYFRLNKSWDRTYIPLPFARIKLCYHLSTESPNPQVNHD